MKKIGVTGCSHSSFSWGNPWHHYLGENFDVEIISSSSSGAGNEMFIQKIKYILENHTLDYFIVQLTDPNRLVMGINDTSINDYSVFNGTTTLHSNNVFENVIYYTFNSHDNSSNFKRIFGKDFNCVDDLFINNILNSKYNEQHKIFHTMMTMQNLCDHFNVKLIFFSWFVDIFKLSVKSGYQSVIKNMSIIPGDVLSFCNKNKIYPIPNEGHYDSEACKKIFDQFLFLKLKSYIL